MWAHLHCGGLTAVPWISALIAWEREGGKHEEEKRDNCLQERPATAPQFQPHTTSPRSTGSLADVLRDESYPYKRRL